jgi:hypothetical protein
MNPHTCSELAFCGLLPLIWWYLVHRPLPLHTAPGRPALPWFGQARTSPWSRRVRTSPRSKRPSTSPWFKQPCVGPAASFPQLPGTTVSWAPRRPAGVRVAA